MRQRELSAASCLYDPYHPPVLFFLVHLAARRLLRVLAGTSSVAALEMENAVLRHQLAVLRRTGKRVGAENSDRPGGPAASPHRVRTSA